MPCFFDESQAIPHTKLTQAIAVRCQFRTLEPEKTIHHPTADKYDIAMQCFQKPLRIHQVLRE
ncbi:CLUMA_CG015993, isoform A [Clunio marinus]|uniref:CLUMA_CG015993, isoform A n=1 Tax=Clunio marinus TaxID=568069 RepID=A0A1J1IR44_9DIPT|nr:CLUMA_CG015993, isoform A [Clunio marinus]